MKTKILLFCVLTMIVFSICSCSSKSVANETPAVMTTSVFLLDTNPIETLNATLDGYQAFLMHMQDKPLTLPRSPMLYLAKPGTWN